MGKIALEYRKKFDKAFKEKFKELTAEFEMNLMIFKDTLPEKILCELLIKNKDFLPLHFVILERGETYGTYGIYPVYYLGEINERNLYFYLDEKEFYGEVLINRIMSCKINEDDILKIIKVLEEKAEHGIISNEIAVPKGYVALRHKATFTSISGLEEEGSYMFAYRAETLDVALNLIPRLTGVH